MSKRLHVPVGTSKLTKNLFEKTAWLEGRLVCGIDEVGRGTGTIDGLAIDDSELLDYVHTSARYRANLIAVYARRAIAALNAAK